MIANGGTIVEVLNKLRERRVKRIAVACTHGLFTGKAIARPSGTPLGIRKALHLRPNSVSEDN